MPKAKSPRHGSLQFWPRKRAKRIVPRRRAWPCNSEPKPLGFCGYKVQMLHALIIDNRSKARTKGETLSVPVTLIECPPIRLLSVRFYKKTPSGLRISYETLLTNDRRLRKLIPLPKTLEPKLEGVNTEGIDELRVLAYTQTHLTSRGQKVPEIFELALGGSVAEQLDWVKQHIGKDIRLPEVFSEGEQVDISGVTKGKGFQGTVKRFGVSIRQHKSEKTKRGIGNLGPWHPARVLFSVPQAGKMGFHTRTEKNKWILRISNEDINPKGGFTHYGTVKNEYMLLKGSVPGPAKRLVRIFRAQRPSSKIPAEPPQIEKVVVR